MRSRLIINADDFGQTPGINRAVVELHRAGVLTSATLMANGRALDDAIHRARTAPALGVGAHLVFVDGTPVSPPELIPTLLGADGRTFRESLADFAQAVLRRSVEPVEIEREALAQIRRLQDAGISVTHVDTHKHTHMFPPVARAILQSAAKCGVRSIRNPFEPGWSQGLAGGAGIGMRRLQMRLLGGVASRFRSLTRDMQRDGLVPEGTLGIAATGTLDATKLRSMLRALPANSTYELCCHPGHVDAVLNAEKTRLRVSREVELQALLEVVPEILRNSGAPQLIHYGNLGIPGIQPVSLRQAGYEKVL